MQRKYTLLTILCYGISGLAFSQVTDNHPDKFRQFYTDLPTPNEYRTASGAPGHLYYQVEADYNMNIELDDARQRLFGNETITFHNNSPDKLEYIWLQLDQNVRAQNSMTKATSTESIDPKMDFGTLAYMHNDFDGGFKIEYVQDAKGNPLPYTINNTMMRVDPPEAVKSGETFTFRVKWWYNINNRAEIGGRSGYEYFPEDSAYLYTIAQFFPRMCLYNDVEGWQNKQFLGRGEFTLPFGDYRVNLTVPASQVVAATGVLQNANSVLTAAQRSRLDQALKADQPVFIITEAEAIANTGIRKGGNKTWTFFAENVRDFAWAASRKFIWDAQAVNVGGNPVLCMSYYPREGNPLWEKYSTKVVAHTILTYSKYTIDYPYPVAISVHTNNIGMEYPMICFNGGRPEPDGTYSERTKYGMISVIIHEVGHNFFPMIINSDERQWTWMDEGLNTFVQYLTEQEWDREYPSRRGPAYKIVDYMKGDKSNISPIMTNSESIHQFGNNAYGKPATALNILRETVMGRELFDYAFKTYCERWKFKHPTPADLFRTLEDASAVDLDWFWRGWFFTTDHVDIALDGVKWYQVSTANPVVEKAFNKENDANQETFIGDIRNKESIPQTMIEKDSSTLDFYNRQDPYQPDLLDQRAYEKYMRNLEESERSLLEAGYNYYELSFSNNGGLVMPVILEFTFEDGSTQYINIPAEIWRQNNNLVTKVFSFPKEVIQITLDPYLETADTDRNNNYWPPRAEPTRFELFKHEREGVENPMQREKRIRDMESHPSKGDQE